ncbi:MULTISPECIES: N-acetylmuramoyl-L-alanine amidase [Dehalobacter]|jgi:N-acetylmuramoyl-L-alanine amidase|uniref:N-acetylmuramoyl-L-alanine amidase n=2 Tax=Dehalobacter restrictus TaxID=55583 RepID=A0A857DHA4_9FIRM|nr:MULTISPECIES: N-acetylmuramoyl-L-alanine amidase [Dehalobacter]MCG1024409.1 N-acetylmuramoyl-L-alanine amidase [Dehalobacter sp.]MDJ0306875.1 N-acetylmuramoyl-L-alanine amidase [Dehalobacter sp.]OCZ53747.1 N-acetylmuramoyl-L-alanine amidase [Dehalobacter sp. TeCB1]QGZ99674.1 N-acetylmuramoyl-L-alanine amidase [Dehalobacter restrictus]
MAKHLNYSRISGLMHGQIMPRPKIILASSILILLAVTGIFLSQKTAVHTAKDVPGWSWILGGVTISIDAGHGGVDPGAVGVNKTLEKDVNLQVSKRLQVLFTQAGSKVVMLREQDRDFGTSLSLLQRKREDLAYRIQTAMESQAKIYLSIHANSFSDQRQHGPQVFYHPESDGGKLLAESIQQSLNKVGTKEREAKANQSYFILKNTDMVAVTIEVGFLSNPEEEKKLNESAYQQQLAMAIFEGVGNYLAKEQPVAAAD